MATVLASNQSVRGAAVAAAIGFGCIAVFQLALSMGAPLGRAAWGGAHVHLPTGFRIASAFAMGIWTLAAFIVLARAGFEILMADPRIGSSGCLGPGGHAGPRRAHELCLAE
jgi:hypothetical protein